MEIKRKEEEKQRKKEEEANRKAQAAMLKEMEKESAEEVKRYCLTVFDLQMVSLQFWILLFKFMGGPFTRSQALILLFEKVTDAVSSFIFNLYLWYFILNRVATVMEKSWNFWNFKDFWKFWKSHGI